MAETPVGSLSVAETLDRLAEIESVEYPFVSLYLDTRADQKGRDHFWPFVRKELGARARTYPLRSPQRESFDRDAERIERSLREDLKPSANGAALFACAGRDGFYEVLQLEAPFDENRLAVGNRPHLYPLARLIDENPRFAVLLADTRSALVYVFARGRKVDSASLESDWVHRTRVGGWSQMRYQRHADEHQAKHARDSIEALERVVEQDRVDHIVLAGDEVILPLLKAELPKALSEKVIDTLHLEMRASEADVAEAAASALREHDARTDAEKVERLLDEYRSGGLGVVGPEDTLAALVVGQVDELLLSANLNPGVFAEGPGAPGESNAPRRDAAEKTPRAASEIADDLVRLARQTSARITFIEETGLLAEIGGVGGLLRYRFGGFGQEKSGQEKSKKNNVNPDFYKIGGRGRPSDIAPVREQEARKAVPRSAGPPPAARGGPARPPVRNPGRAPTAGPEQSGETPAPRGRKKKRP